MTDSATLKVHRASENIFELNELLSESRPFRYVIETNANTGQRTTRPKQNESVINAVALLCGDAIHNLRTALDHAYWEIVSPHVPEGDRASIQFPFSKTEARLDEAVKNRLAHRVSPKFFDAIIALKPHREPGGNELLYFIHEMDLLDKHRLLIPTGDYTQISGAIIRRQVPDFPMMLASISVGQNREGDVSWFIAPLDEEKRRALNVPESGILEQELDIPVQIVFSVAPAGHQRPVVPTLHQLVDVTKETVRIMRAAI